MSDLPPPRFLPAGDRALVVEFGDDIDDATNARVLALAGRIHARYGRSEGVLGVVPTYRSLTIMFDPLRISNALLRQRIRECLQEGQDNVVPARRWRVPVCYGGTYGEDLDQLAMLHHLRPEQVIELHCSPVYRVYMVGFLPGFAYLGGLDPRLHTPRRSAPRAVTPAGSINIGGQQTAVASVAGPSGWHLLGRTPWRSFDPRRADPFLFAAGDEVVFMPIDAARFAELEACFSAPDCVPEPENIVSAHPVQTGTGL